MVPEGKALANVPVSAGVWGPFLPELQASVEDGVPLLDDPLAVFMMGDLARTLPV